MGTTLAGTYAEAPQPVAAALLIPGSGQRDRDSDVHLPLHQLLRGGITRQMAETLLGRARCRRCGCQQTRGRRQRRRLPDDRHGPAPRRRPGRARWLAARAAGLPLIALGHSEGDYAAQMAADGEVAGGCSKVEAARTGADVLAWQTEQMATRLPRSARMVLRLMRTDAIRAQRKNQERIMASADDVMRIQGTKVNARWVRDFVASDPGRRWPG